MNRLNITTPLLKKGLVVGTETGALFSEQFQDIYFSKAGGFAESTHVFIQGNQLLERWKNTQRFVIAELGFGTGLNFVNTLKHWQEYAPRHAHLLYISCEYYPLSKNSLEKFWQQFPEYTEISGKLIARLPSALPGFHRIHFSELNCTLTLLFGEATTMYQQLDAQVDAWFLDGFSPAKNPELWSEELFREVSRLTKCGGTIASYSVAHVAQRNLAACGFQLEKQKGFAEKKEMLVGTKPKNYAAPEQSAEKSAIVIGGSLAGCSTAHALAQRGWKVTILEKRSLQQLSANYNTIGITYPLLSSDWNLQTHLYCNGMLYTLQLLHTLREKHPQLSFQQCGMNILATRPREQERFFKLQNLGWLPEDFLQFIPKTSPQGFDTLHLPQAGWIQPSSLITALLQNPLIRYYPEHEVVQLHNTGNEWVAQTKMGEAFSAAHVVVANAAEAQKITQTANINLKSIRGQVTYLPKLPELSLLNKIICAEGYITPEINGFHHLGASYDLERTETELLLESHEKNMQQLKHLLPGVELKLDLEKLGGRVGFRTIAPDRMPIVGQHGSEKNLWLNLAHGSRGLISCPLAGEHLASTMNGDPLPLPKNML